MNGLQKKTVLIGAYLLTVSLGFSAAPAPHDLSLVVLPERVNLVQAGFDVIDKRPAALVTYRTTGDSGDIVLHAWNGRQWVFIPLEDYADGRFLTRTPVRILIVGDDEVLPDTLLEASQWGPMVMNINTERTDDFLNAAGSLLSFNDAEWSWFARRYNMKIEDLHAGQQHVSWYDQMTAARQRPERRRTPAPHRMAPSRPQPPPAKIETRSSGSATEVEAAPRPPAPPVAVPAPPTPVVPSAATELELIDDMYFQDLDVFIK